MANLWQPSINRVLDENGNPASGALLSIYRTGSVIPETFFLDEEGITVGANPLQANANGVLPTVFLDPDLVYRILLTDSTGSEVIYDVDPVRGFDESAAGAVLIAAQDAAQTAVDNAQLTANDVITTGNNVTAASESASSAAADASIATSARDQAVINSANFADTEAEGRAAVADGEFHTAPSTLETGYIDLFQRVDTNTSTLIDTYPNIIALNEVLSSIEPITNTLAAAAAIPQSVKFPDYNGQVREDFGRIFQSTAGMGNLFDGDGCYFTIIDAPHERLSESKFFLISGNNFGQGGVNRLLLDFAGFSVNHADAGRFRIFANGVIAVSEVLPSTVSRVLVACRKSGNSLTVDLWDCDTGDKLAGVPSNAASMVAFTPTSHLFFGDGWAADAERPSFNSIYSAWTGSMSWIGHSTINPTDAMLQGVSNGNNPLNAFGDNFRFLRKLNGFDSGNRSVAGVTETALPSEFRGEVKGNGSIARTGNITLDRLVDGFVYGVIPNNKSKSIEITGRLAITENDVVEARIVSVDGGEEIVGWQRIANVAVGDNSFTGSITCPKHITWLRREVRLASDRNNTFLDSTRFGVGYKMLVVGQSELDFMESRSGLNKIYLGHVPASYVALKSVNGVTNAQCNVLGFVDISDGYIAMAEQFAATSDAVFQIVVDAVGGTSPIQWIDDDITARNWSDLTSLTAVSGSDFSTIVWQWYASFISNDTQNIKAVFDAALLGTGDLANDHFFYEIAQSGATMTLCPAKRYEATGANLDFSGYPEAALTRETAIDWAQDNGAIIGSWAVDLTLVDRFHQPNTLEGDVRLGWHLGISAARGCGADSSSDPYVKPDSFIFNAGRTSFTFDVVSPNGGQIRNALGGTSDDGIDKEVRGIEVSEDGGVTWTRSGFTALISGRRRIAVTKATGSWPEGLKCRVGAGGPFAYGIGSLTEGNAVAENYWIYDGYEPMLNGVGLTVKTSSDIYDVNSI